MPRKKIDPAKKRVANTTSVRISKESHDKVVSVNAQVPIGIGELVERIIDNFMRLTHDEQRDAIFPREEPRSK